MYPVMLTNVDNNPTKTELIMVYLQLLYSYLKIGFFGFGGGYAMLALIQNEIVVRHHWLTNSELTDIIAISQMTPGPIAINSATYVGYTVTGEYLGFVAGNFCSQPAFAYDYAADHQILYGTA